MRQLFSDAPVLGYKNVPASAIASARAIRRGSSRLRRWHPSQFVGQPMWPSCWRWDSARVATNLPARCTRRPCTERARLYCQPQSSHCSEPRRPARGGRRQSRRAPHQAAVAQSPAPLRHRLRARACSMARTLDPPRTDCGARPLRASRQVFPTAPGAATAPHQLMGERYRGNGVGGKGVVYPQSAIPRL